MTDFPLPDRPANSPTPRLPRRDVLRTGAAMTTAGLAGLHRSLSAAPAPNAPQAPQADSPQQLKVVLKGKLPQSVCRWCFPKIPLEKFALAAAGIGLSSVELLKPAEHATVKAAAGLTCAVLSGAGPIEKGLNRREYHAAWQKGLRDLIDYAAAEGLPNVICFSGNRAGQSDDQGLATCADGLQPVLTYAEEKKVTILMELLNSKVNHKDYMADHTAWGVALCQKLSSPRFKLLYDIYHMQIMEGNVIATIKANSQWIGHYHTAGVPGRNELDENQELNYPAIVKAIIATGYTGYLGQEFIPRRDPLTSLRQAVELCDL